ncbi:T9SS type A sorting domain-containing protein [bacterium]|nr:T9SS type A sorting domain-containing protein [bacterium]
MRSSYAIAVLILLTVQLTAQPYQTVYPGFEHVEYTGLFVLGQRVYRVGLEHVIEMSSDNGETWHSLTPHVRQFNIVQVAAARDYAIATLLPMRWAPDGWEDSTHTSLLLFTKDEIEPRLIEVPWFIPVTEPFRRYLFCDATDDAIFLQQGYTDAALIRSTDLGRTWEKLPIPDSLNTRHSLYFHDRDVGMLIGMHLGMVGTFVFTTQDAGRSWMRASVAPCPSWGGELYDRLKPPAIWISADTVMYLDESYVTQMSTDGGETWSPQTNWSGSITSYFLGRDGSGYLAFDGGTIAKTSGFGANAITIRESLYLNSRQIPLLLHTEPDNLFYADVYGVTAHSNDGGLSWVDEKYQRYTSATRPRIFSMDTVFMSVYPTQEPYSSNWYMRTTDGGETWDECIDMRNRDWENLHVATPEVWYATRATTPEDDDIVLRTSDAGRTWNAVDEGSSDWLRINTWKGTFSVGEEVFWFPMDSVFRATNDGGTTWRSIDPGVGRLYQGTLDISHYPYCYFVTAGLIFSSTDGGDHWSRFPSAPRSWRTGQLAITPNGTVYVQARDNSSGASVEKMFRSFDHGATWDSVDVTQTQITFSTIDDEGRSCGYAARSIFQGGRPMVSTTDGWQTFRVEGEMFSDVFQDIRFIDSDNGYVTTRYSIFKTTNGGINWTNVTPSIPQSPRILSIWPQPLTQGGMMSTEIELIRPGPVRIELYDLLGRRRAVVWDAEVTVTRRTVQWSTIGLERGVYVLRMAAGNGVASGKVVVN